MNDISNISTLITIIFGLMLTDLFASLHRLIRKRRIVRWHWLPLLVSWYVLATVLKNWWTLISQQGNGYSGGGWLFFFYGHVLLLLYLVVSAALPDEVPDEGIDLKVFYIENRRHFWGLLAGLSLFTMLWPFFAGLSFNWEALLSNIVLGTVALSLVKVKRIEYHAVVIVLLVSLTTTELFFKF